MNFAYAQKIALLEQTVKVLEEKLSEALDRITKLEAKKPLGLKK